MVRHWKPDKILVEDKAGGAGMLRTLEIEMAAGDVPMVTLEAVNPGTQDKEMRVNSAIPHFANGMVLLLDGAPWVDALVEEVSGFPSFTTDDRTDALTQCVLHERDQTMQLPSEESWREAGL